ncbi:MAG TPA: MdtA/MuxA family multidrug efflux RND transporter periplasmic adaptor subunit [Bryobacteraceae bacterium]|nr:MdtA/MuxA family multidrug efflux RND transporter periplasmic adaptor subunit [Bryobacteraceae bacterium]
MTTNIPNPEPTHAVGDKPKKRGLVWLVLFAAVAAVAVYAVIKAGQPGQIIQSGGGGRGGSGGRGGRGQLGPTPVGIEKARLGEMPVYYNGLGTVSAYYTVAVKTRVDGQLMSVNFQEGDIVRKGQTIAVIDTRPFEVQLHQAQGTLDRDTAMLANARKDLERYQALVKQNAVPQQQVDTQVSTVQQLEGTVKQDQAAVDNANLQITYANVPAPITGRVGLRLVDPGNIVHASDANGILVITQIEPIAVLFTLPEKQLPDVVTKLNAGKKLLAEAWNPDDSQKLSDGYLLTIDNQIDSTTGTSKMKAIFDNRNLALFPNQFVNIHLLVNTLCNQVIVPNVAVQSGQQGTFVYVVDAESKVHMRPVTVRLQLENDSAIASGLEAGEQVVVDGTDRLIDGATVRLRTAADINGTGRGGRGARGGSGRGARGGSGRSGGGAARGAAAGPGASNAAAGAAGGAVGGGGFGGGRGARGGRGGGRGASGGRGAGLGPAANLALDPDAPPPLDMSSLDIGCPGDSRGGSARGGRQGGGGQRGGGRRGGGGGQ